MASYLIQPASRLSGEVDVSASKNATLPILAAGLLTAEPLVVRDAPDITDVESQLEILRLCGATVRREGRNLTVCADAPHSPGPDETMGRLRASVLVLGPVLARAGAASVTLPGGCAIGQRPIDLHLKGLQAMGAVERQSAGRMELVGRLTGASVYLDLPSVGATENLLMAATLAKGETTIVNAAKEPEIIDLADCLIAMGARIQGAGTGSIRVQGVERLHGAVYRPIPDRIEAGTLLCAAAVTPGSVLLRGARPDHMRAVLFKLAEAGASIRETRAGVRISGCVDRAFEVRTLAYPGFPTDMQAPISVAALRPKGASVIMETIFENRFMHAAELRRMGARIRTEGNVAVIEGGEPLTGCAVSSTDLRACAALMLAGLIARGETTLHDPAGHLRRGYDDLPGKLCRLGASIRTAEGEA